jgi:glutamine synthetase
MIARAEAESLHVKAAFENEFYLLRPEAREPTPVDSTVFAQTYALDLMAPVLDNFTAALEAQGVLPEQVYSESGGGQFEMPVRYTDALAAADQQVVFRETIRAVAHLNGLTASFLPKIFGRQAGNGSHLHFSLWEGEDNIVPSPEDPTSLSPQATSFVAGVLHHLPALTSLTTPSANSFKRVRPRSWAGAYACWGYGNREGAIRVPQQSDGPITNVELKTVDSTCNPYLALGAVIAAGLDGIKRGMLLPDPIQMDPADLGDDERETRKAWRLPTNLGEAINALQHDAVLSDALGADLFRSFVAVRRMEWEALKDLPDEEEVRLLLERY